MILEFITYIASAFINFIINNLVYFINNWYYFRLIIRIYSFLATLLLTIFFVIFRFFCKLLTEKKYFQLIVIVLTVFLIGYNCKNIILLTYECFILILDNFSIGFPELRMLFFKYNDLSNNYNPDNENSSIVSLFYYFKVFMNYFKIVPLFIKLIYKIIKDFLYFIISSIIYYPFIVIKYIFSFLLYIVLESAHIYDKCEWIYDTFIYYLPSIGFIFSSILYLYKILLKFLEAFDDTNIFSYLSDSFISNIYKPIKIIIDYFQGESTVSGIETINIIEDFIIDISTNVLDFFTRGIFSYFIDLFNYIFSMFYFLLYFCLTFLNLVHTIFYPYLWLLYHFVKNSLYYLFSIFFRIINLLIYIPVEFIGALFIQPGSIFNLFVMFFVIIFQIFVVILLFNYFKFLMDFKYLRNNFYRYSRMYNGKKLYETINVLFIRFKSQIFYIFFATLYTSIISLKIFLIQLKYNALLLLLSPLKLFKVIILFINTPVGMVYKYIKYFLVVKTSKGKILNFKKTIIVPDSKYCKINNIIFIEYLIDDFLGFREFFDRTRDTFGYSSLKPNSYFIRTIQRILLEPQIFLDPETENFLKSFIELDNCTVDSSKISELYTVLFSDLFSILFSEETSIINRKFSEYLNSIKVDPEGVHKNHILFFEIFCNSAELQIFKRAYKKVLKDSAKDANSQKYSKKFKDDFVSTFYTKTVLNYYTDVLTGVDRIIKYSEMLNITSKTIGKMNIPFENSTYSTNDELIKYMVSKTPSNKLYINNFFNVFNLFENLNDMKNIAGNNTDFILNIPLRRISKTLLNVDKTVRTLNIKYFLNSTYLYKKYLLIKNEYILYFVNLYFKGNFRDLDFWTFVRKISYSIFLILVNFYMLKGVYYTSFYISDINLEAYYYIDFFRNLIHSFIFYILMFFIGTGVILVLDGILSILFIIHIFRRYIKNAFFRSSVSDSEVYTLGNFLKRIITTFLKTCYAYSTLLVLNFVADKLPNINYGIFANTMPLNSTIKNLYKKGKYLLFNNKYNSEDIYNNVHNLKESDGLSYSSIIIKKPEFNISNLFSKFDNSVNNNISFLNYDQLLIEKNGKNFINVNSIVYLDLLKESLNNNILVNFIYSVEYNLLKNIVEEYSITDLINLIIGFIFAPFFYNIFIKFLFFYKSYGLIGFSIISTVLISFFISDGISNLFNDNTLQNFKSTLMPIFLNIIQYLPISYDIDTGIFTFTFINSNTVQEFFIRIIQILIITSGIYAYPTNFSIKFTLLFCSSFLLIFLLRTIDSKFLDSKINNAIYKYTDFSKQDGFLFKFFSEMFFNGIRSIILLLFCDDIISNKVYFFLSSVYILIAANKSLLKRIILHLSFFKIDKKFTSKILKNKIEILLRDVKFSDKKNYYKYILNLMNIRNFDSKNVEFINSNPDNKIKISQYKTFKNCGFTKADKKIFLDVFKVLKFLSDKKFVILLDKKINTHNLNIFYDNYKYFLSKDSELLKELSFNEYDLFINNIDAYLNSLKALRIQFNFLNVELIPHTLNFINYILDFHSPEKNFKIIEDFLFSSLFYEFILHNYRTIIINKEEEINSIIKDSFFEDNTLLNVLLVFSVPLDDSIIQTYNNNTTDQRIKPREIPNVIITGNKKPVISSIITSYDAKTRGTNISSNSNEENLEEKSDTLSLEDVTIRTSSSDLKLITSSEVREEKELDIDDKKYDDESSDKGTPPSSDFLNSDKELVFDIISSEIPNIMDPNLTYSESFKTDITNIRLALKDTNLEKIILKIRNSLKFMTGGKYQYYIQLNNLFSKLINASSSNNNEFI